MKQVKVITDKLYDFVLKVGGQFDKTYATLFLVMEDTISETKKTEFRHKLRELRNENKNIETVYQVVKRAETQKDVEILKTFIELRLEFLAYVEKETEVETGYTELMEEYLKVLKEKVKTIGMFGGKFNLHNGHIYAILQSASKVDKLYVVVSYIEERDKKLAEEAGIKYANPQQRALWITQATKHIPNIEVICVEDVPMNEEYSLEEVWRIGADRIKESIPETITHVFSSEPSYTKWFEKNYENATHVIIDEARKNVPISSTKLREEGIYSNWDMIPKVAQPFFAKKVAIVGVESTAKSTTTKSLATIFNTNFVEEYGRTRCEELGNGSELLQDYNYTEFVIGQKHDEHRKILDANKVMFIDSEAVVSQYYAKMYQGHELSIIESTIELQDYDMYIYLENDVEWVSDGYRTFSDTETRNTTNDILKSMFKERNIDFITVKGNYQERLNQCIDLVNNLLYK